MYIQRYVPHLPSAGEVVIFDRSWYNRAGVERVMGFCTEEESKRFLTLVPGVEQAMVHWGIILIKYWLEVSSEEQTRRLESRIDDPRKVWKLSKLDRMSYSRWDDYSRARDDMLATTDTVWAPWPSRAHRRQEACPPQHHHPPAPRPGAVRAAEAPRHRASEAQGVHQGQATGCAAEAHPARRSSGSDPSKPPTHPLPRRVAPRGFRPRCAPPLSRRPSARARADGRPAGGLREVARPQRLSPSTVAGRREAGERLEQAELDRVLDGLAATRCLELAVDRDGMRLDRVRREEDALADLLERQRRRQDGKQSQLRRREGR